MLGFSGCPIDKESVQELKSAVEKLVQKVELKIEHGTNDKQSRANRRKFCGCCK